MLLSLTFSLLVFAGGSYNEQHTVEKQYELLIEFLNIATDPMSRMDFNNVFTGGLWGTPLEPSGFDEFEDNFIIGITCYSHMYNENNRELISLFTGIPLDRISFAYIYHHETPRDVFHTVEEWIDINPATAYELINIIIQNPDIFVDYYTYEELLLFNEFAENFNAATIGDDSDIAYYGIVPFEILPNMGERIRIWQPHRGGFADLSLGHPTLGLNRFFTL